MISVVIPVYKKVDEFVSNLDHNLKYLKGSEIIVVNDDPSNSIKDRLKKYDIQLIENSKNLGFAGAVDKGVKAAKHNLIFLLNSDVRLLDNTYLSSIKKFAENSQIFGIAFAQKDGNTSMVGKNKVFWKNGLLAHSAADDLSEGETAWAEGGSSVIRRDVYEEIGGFDTIFSPFYWEDIELSQRAKKYGYICWFDPDVVVEHRHESTIGSFWNKRAISVIATRNQILCTWKFMSLKYILPHTATVLYQTILSVLRGNFVFAEGLVKALPFLFGTKFYKIR